MKATTTKAIYLFIALILSGCSNLTPSEVAIYDKTPEEIIQIDNKFERFTSLLVGHYSNRSQADTSAVSMPVQELVVRQIWQDRPNEFWVCVTWFMEGSYERPMMTRVDQYQQIAPDTFSATTFSIPDIDEKFEEWRKPNGFKNLSPKDLLENKAQTFFIFEDFSSITSVNDRISPASVASELIKYNRVSFNVVPAMVSMKAELMDAHKNTMAMTQLHFSRIDRNDDRYYAFLRPLLE